MRDGTTWYFPQLTGTARSPYNAEDTAPRWHWAPIAPNFR